MSLNKMMDFLDSRRQTTMNFNRVFNLIIIILNIAVLILFKYLDSLGVFKEEDNKYKFLKRATSVSYVSMMLTLSVFASIQKYNKTYCDAIAVCNNILFSLFFQIVSGLLRSYLFYTSDPLLFVTSIEIIIRYLIVTNWYPSFKIMGYSSFFILSYSWISMIMYHATVPSPIIFYNTIQTLVFAMLTTYARTYESTKIIESELKKTSENERNYYINILDNLNVGFFITQGSKINLYNKNISQLMSNYNKSKEYLVDDDETKFDENQILKQEKSLTKKKVEDPFEFLRFLYQEDDEEDENDEEKKLHQDGVKIEEFIEILLSNFQSFVPKTNHNLIKLFRSNSSRKLQLIRPIISNLKEFNEFTKVGRIKLNMDIDDYLYFDISFRATRNRINKDYQDLVEFILNDVTQVIQVEKDKNDIKFKSVLLAKIAHEFKNPINTINAICTSLNIKVMQDPEILLAFQKLQNINDYKTNNFNFIVSLCDYLLFLIEDLNSFVKFGLGKRSNKDKDKDSLNSDSPAPSDKSFQNKMTSLNLVQLLDFCYDIFHIRQAYDKGKPCLKIVKSYSADLPERFYTNETKLKQVIINLLSNAYKFTVSGFVKLGAKFINTRDKKSIVFSVTDTGTGLDKEEIKNIFKPFEVAERNQLHNCQGSGLGLSIVNDILEQFDSKIVVESELGKGSTFYFELEHIAKLVLDNDVRINEDDELEYEDMNKYNPDGDEKTKKSISYLVKESEKKDQIADEHKSVSSGEEAEIASNKSKETNTKELITEGSDFHKELIDEFRKSKRFGTSIGLNKYRSSGEILIASVNRSPVLQSAVLNNSDCLANLIVMPKAAAPKAVGAKFSVMICDDEHLIAESVDRLLKKVSKRKKIDIETKIAKNGIECLYQVYKDSLEGKKLDLLLIDENMPFMIGSECIRILKNIMNEKRINKFKIFSITGYMDSEHISYIKASGSDGFYNKPISLNMMLDLLVKCDFEKKK